MELRTRIKLLERLIEAYLSNDLRRDAPDENWRPDSLP